MDETQTTITLKNVGLSYREAAKRIKLSARISFRIKRSSETGGNSDRKSSGRPKVTTEPEEKFLRVNIWAAGASRDHRFQNNFILVFVRGSRF